MIYGILLGLSLIIGSLLGFAWWGLGIGFMVCLLLFLWLKYGFLLRHRKPAASKETVVEEKKVEVKTTTVEKRTYAWRLLDGLKAFLLLVLGLVLIALAFYWLGPWFRLWIDDANVSLLPEQRQEKAVTLSGPVVQEFRECGLKNGLWHYELTGDTTVSTLGGKGEADLVAIKLWGTLQNADPAWYQRYQGNDGPKYYFALLANGKAPGETVRISNGCVTWAINVPYFILAQQLKGDVKFKESYHVTAVFTQH